MEDRTIVLDTKPGAPLHILTLGAQPAEGNPLSDVLVVFLNGLVLPCSSWSAAVDHLVDMRRQANEPLPTLVCYDRYGQGKSDPDPTDAEGTPYGHGPRAVVDDLHQLVAQVGGGGGQVRGVRRLVLVCNSIGCALARLYAAAHPGRVAACLFLDSMMANSDFVSVFPDPDGPDFDHPGRGRLPLPPGVSADDLRHARDKFRQYFHPAVPNPERLDRRDLRRLLPRADAPALPAGPGGRSPILVVVGHDWDEFAEQCEKGSLSVSKAVINAYLNPAWAAYNEGLTRLVEGQTEVKIAEGCGHFIQKDDPVFVAAEINGILNELQNRK